MEKLERIGSIKQGLWLLVRDFQQDYITYQKKGLLCDESLSILKIGLVPMIYEIYEQMENFHGLAKQVLILSKAFLIQ